jgi:hypothetical protein
MGSRIALRGRTCVSNLKYFYEDFDYNYNCNVVLWFPVELSGPDLGLRRGTSRVTSPHCDISVGWLRHDSHHIGASNSENRRQDKVSSTSCHNGHWTARHAAAAAGAPWLRPGSGAGNRLLNTLSSQACHQPLSCQPEWRPCHGPAKAPLPVADSDFSYRGTLLTGISTP